MELHDRFGLPQGETQALQSTDNRIMGNVPCQLCNHVDHDLSL